MFSFGTVHLNWSVKLQTNPIQTVPDQSQTSPIHEIEDPPTKYLSKNPRCLTQLHLIILMNILVMFSSDLNYNRNRVHTHHYIYQNKSSSIHSVEYPRIWFYPNQMFLAQLYTVVFINFVMGGYRWTDRIKTLNVSSLGLGLGGVIILWIGCNVNMSNIHLN